MDPNEQPARFLRDIAGHSMKVIHDSGEFRHLRFDKNGSSCMHFNLTTWPGYLCISGDMGCYTFWRTNDMFTFFRREDLGINPGYWSEKLESISRHGGVEEFDFLRFSEVLKEIVAERFDGEAEDDAKEKAEVLAELDEMLAGCDEGSFDSCLKDAYDFRVGRFRFEDLWEYRCQKFTFNFIWCLYAIVWGIQQYDKAKTVPAEAAAA